MKQTRITIRQLQAFMDLAKTGNFHKAAAYAGQSQSALSASLKQLERELGVSLMDRTTRHVSVSKAGQELLAPIERILADIEHLSEQAEAISAGRAGPIRIVGLHSITTHLLPPVIATFARTNPGVTFSVEENTTSEIIHDVSRGAADVGFTSFRASATDLTFEPLLSDAYMLVTPSGHPLSKRRAATWEELEPYPFLAMTRGTQTRDLMDELLQASGRSIRPAHEAFHFDTIEQFILQGMGISVIPALALGRERRKRFAVRPVTAPAIARHLGVVTHKRRKRPAALTNFLEALRTHVSKLRLAGITLIQSPK